MDFGSLIFDFGTRLNDFVRWKQLRMKFRNDLLVAAPVQPFKEFENCNAADGEFLVTLQISKQVSQTILRLFGAWVLECPLNIKQGATVYEAFIHAT